jgi:hypothetical protein
MYLFAAVSSLPTSKITPGLNGDLVDGELDNPEAVEAVEAVDHNHINVDASLRDISPAVIPYDRLRFEDVPIAIP